MNDRQGLIEVLLLAMDGDNLPSAGLSIGNEGDDVALSEARPKEVACWAVDAVLAAGWRPPAQEGERGGAEAAAAVEIDTPDREVVARIIDTEAFGQHALTWKPSPGDFPSNWQNRRDAAYRKADEIAALYSADPAGALATHDAEVLRAAAARFKSDAPLTAAYVRDCLNADAARIEAQS